MVEGNGTFCIDPLAKRWIDALGKIEHQTLQNRAVAREIVAAERRERGNALGPAARQALDEIADDAARRMRVGKVGGHIGMLEVEPPGGGVEAIGLFGDGQADDPDGRIFQTLQQVAGIAGAPHAPQDRPDDLGLRARRIAHQHGVEAVLLVQVIGDVGGAQARHLDPPIAAGMRPAPHR
jgi:hypothetical protein